ncbi:ribose 5-phosphate isomerase B [Thermosulfuriphilus sp.]
MRIAIGADHAGFPLKEKIRVLLEELGHQVEDAGCYSCESVDYPLFGAQVAEKISQGHCERGVLICGTGIGMSLVANRFPRVRAALCHELYTARMSRLHNDANILVIGGRVVGEALALEMVKIFLETPFEGGRHARRLELIDKLTVQEK